MKYLVYLIVLTIIASLAIAVPMNYQAMNQHSSNSRTIVPTKRIADKIFDISSLFGGASTSPSNPHKKARLEPQVLETTSSTPSHMEHEVSATTSNNLMEGEAVPNMSKIPSFEEFKSLQHYTDAHGNKQAIDFEAFKVIVSGEKRKVTDQRQLILRKMKRKGVPYQLPKNVEKDNALPSLRGLRTWPDKEKFNGSNMVEQNQWIHALELYREHMGTEAIAPIKSSNSHFDKYNGKVWSADTLHSDVEKLTDEEWKGLTTRQRDAIKDHQAIHKPNEKLGNARSKERHSYMRSHQGLRFIGIPYPAPAIGMPKASTEHFTQKLKNRRVYQKEYRNRTKAAAEAQL